jgi:pimeloyl-ACP methyl ester carboxylesterase
MNVTTSVDGSPDRRSRAPKLEVLRAEPATDDGRPALLLVHGGRHAAWCWERWLPVLSDAGWTALAVSLRGHGASAGAVRGATLAQYVDDVVAAAGQLDRPPILIGHSMGGLVVKLALTRTATPAAVLVAPAPEARFGHAIRIAARHPRTVLALVLGRQVPFTRNQLLSSEVSDEDAERVMARLGPESALAQYQVLFVHKPPVPAACPTLVLASPDDAVVAPSEITRTAERYNAEVRWFPGLGHDLMLEARSSELLTALLDWLDTDALRVLCRPAVPVD